MKTKVITEDALERILPKTKNSNNKTKNPKEPIKTRDNEFVLNYESMQ